MTSPHISREYKSYKSVEELVDGTFDRDSDEAKRIRKKLKELEMARVLFSLRHDVDGKLISEEELAERMGVTIEEVERIEHSTAAEISVEQLMKYVNACGYCFWIKRPDGEVNLLDW